MSLDYSLTKSIKQKIDYEREVWAQMQSQSGLGPGGYMVLQTLAWG